MSNVTLVTPKIPLVSLSSIGVGDFFMYNSTVYQKVKYYGLKRQAIVHVLSGSIQDPDAFHNGLKVTPIHARITVEYDTGIPEEDGI
ncbi:hypothetical protein B5P22_31060 [Pseudomonas tolaasii]|uniref:hypothetical protein n=1 Tax=Pseudomonas tolaasii TaxID=29442 RepID=UPI0009B60CD1|nr:hypothetical protein [Pseudomonas tolaasii]ARB31547.1 hypothetical protein B5P22_31060 [Pseudomonas tolaasii]